jgi:molybdopterin synthase sulfur carrier subunit
MVLHIRLGRRIANVSAASDRATGTGQVTMRYWASARAAAGVDSDPLEVSGPTTLADLVARVKALHADSSRFADVLSCCSVMVGDRPVTTGDPTEVHVPPGATVEFLPPFAGG